jgi:hypothetical protein
MAANNEFIDDSIEECIRAVKSVDEREATNRLWELRADVIRKRDLFTNLTAIRNAVKEDFDRLSGGLPERHLEFADNPARYFVVRNPALSGVTVNAGITLDGAVVTIETILHTSPNEVLRQTTDTIRVEVEGSSTCYLHHGKPVTIRDIAGIVLKPLLNSLRQRG